MRLERYGVVVFLGIAALQTGCIGTYRVVSKTPTGGEVALLGMPDKAREKAAAYMASTCPQGYQIVEEREVPVGTRQRSQTTTGTVLNRPSFNTETTTRDETEWRMRFQCNTVSGAAPTPATP